jgi:hypothetical protein
MKRKTDNQEELCYEYYDALIGALRYVAYRCGYALTVHGSLNRDIDLVACPWRDSAISAPHLIKYIQKATKAIIGTARTRDIDQDKQPQIKPCGRLAWAFYLTYDDTKPYLDISVMPKGPK